MSNDIFLARKSRMDTRHTDSITIKPENESVSVDVKNWKIEASGFITWIVVFGVLIIAGAYVYGKFFHHKVKAKFKK